MSCVGRLSDFKGTEAAAECAERATVTHNMLMILSEAGMLNGFTPTLVLSERDGNLHAFNMLTNERGKHYIILDTACLVQIESEDGSRFLSAGVYSLD